nr:hypothetical protein [Bacteroidota bacterium]
MKKQALILLTVVFLIPFLFVACEKEKTENPTNLTTDVTGTYKGSITPSNDPDKSQDAIIEITRADENTVYLNMMSDILDTTFMLNLYENEDSIMVCFTEERFYEEYGHQLDEGHHMMGEGDDWSWMHHMVEQHQTGEEHFGGFELDHHTFSYSIIPVNEPDVYYQFEGIKE